MSKVRSWVIVLGSVLVASLLVRQALTGGLRVVSLDSAPAFSGLVAQSLGGQSEMPVPGRDFNLKDVKYFEDNSWIVADVAPINKKSDPGTVVIHKQNGALVVVLGPGSDFDSSFLVSLPADVGNYLKSKGVIHVSL
jgi:hypothetical protein